jgi:hypothetical protein
LNHASRRDLCNGWYKAIAGAMVLVLRLIEVST